MTRVPMHSREASLNLLDSIAQTTVACTPLNLPWSALHARKPVRGFPLTGLEFQLERNATAPQGLLPSCPCGAPEPHLAASDKHSHSVSRPTRRPAWCSASCCRH